MKSIILVVALSIIMVALAFAGIAIKILVKKNGEFKRHCSSVDPKTGQKVGCVCNKTILDDCKSGPKYHPLEINRELLKECGNLPSK